MELIDGKYRTYPETYSPCKWFILDTNTASSNFSLGSLSCSVFNECWIDKTCVIVSSAVPEEEFVSKYLKNTSEQHGYL